MSEYTFIVKSKDEENSILMVTTDPEIALDSIERNFNPELQIWTNNECIGVEANCGKLELGKIKDKLNKYRNTGYSQSLFQLWYTLPENSKYTSDHVYTSNLFAHNIEQAEEKFRVWNEGKNAIWLRLKDHENNTVKSYM